MPFLYVEYFFKHLLLDFRQIQKLFIIAQNIQKITYKYIFFLKNKKKLIF